MEDRLSETFYHGTARRRPEFLSDACAYFTRSKKEATIYAQMDAEVDGGTPVLISARILARSPAILPMMLMQDLHLAEHRPLVARLIVQGHDCAMADIPDHDELVVFGAHMIEVLDTQPLELVCA